MKINKRVHSFMTRKILLTSAIILMGVFFITAPVMGQDRLPVREYTNPDEVVTFSSNTPFSQAIDVINQFAQEYAGKIIIDRTATQGPIGMRIPPMHWQDALNLILEAKYLQLIERQDYYEIVSAQSPATQAGSTETTAIPDTAITTDSKEIRIEAIFFEGNRRALQEIGVDWSTLTENVPENIGQFVNETQGGGGGGGGGGAGGGGQQQGQLPDVQNFDGPFVSVNSNAAQSVSQKVFSSVINFGEVFGSGISVQALFSAFEADNLGEILASPSVKVLEGQEGHIQVGQDFSIKQRDFAGNVTDRFFSVGTILNVTPRVIERSDTTFIHLDIDAERSSAQPDPVSTIINKQESTTQALLLNNEATVIAGLYRTEAAEVRRGIPILKDLPPWFFGLRYIFGYNSKDYQTRELVIIIKASIEPGIAERMNQELPDKFDALDRERNKMQDEIKRYRDIGNDVTQTRGEIDSLQNDNGDMNDDNQSSLRNEEQQAETQALEDKVEALERELERMRSQNPDTVRVVVNEEANDEANSEMDEPETVELQAEATGDQSAGNEPSKYRPVSDQSYSYYVIGGSFQNKSNAQQYRQELGDKGYDSQMLISRSGNFYLVAYSGYDDWDIAVENQQQIVQNVNEQAWIYEND